MTAIKTANLALRFVLELCALAGLGVWGFWAGNGMLAKLALGLGAPLLAAVVWGLFVAPKATVPVPVPVHLLLQVVIFGLAAAGLGAAGHPQLAGVFGVVVVLNMALLYVWRQ
jgi:hypothetical protein